MANIYELNNVSLSQLKSMVLSGGYKIQSGNFSISGTQNAWVSQAITFPTAFSNLIGIFAFVYGNQLRVYTSASNAIATGANVYCYNTDVTATLYVSWIAIGL